MPTKANCNGKIWRTIGELFTHATEKVQPDTQVVWRLGKKIRI